LEFSAHGFDVYVPDVDDRSVDFVVRSANRRSIEIQVKSLRSRLGIELMCYRPRRVVNALSNARNNVVFAGSRKFAEEWAYCF
jgi:hypothetical protein